MPKMAEAAPERSDSPPRGELSVACGAG